MKIILRILSLSLPFLASACGMDSINRMAYGTAASMQQQQCLESPIAQKQDCLQSGSYDEYQRKRQQSTAQ
jgi:hypothetical protein